MNRSLIFTPVSADAAARFLAESSMLAAEGYDVSVTISAAGTEAGSRGRETLRDEKDLEKNVSGVVDVLVSFENLSGILEISPSDMLVRAKGGTPVSEIAAAAEEAGLWFPHYDGSIGKEMTVAGLLMEAPVLPVSEAYGGLREYILSLELVTGGGEKVHFGSRAVKDVAGYEVIGCLLGGGGRYGMITEATLRLLPKQAGRENAPGIAIKTEEPDEGPLERITARVQKVFDPAGILRW